MTQILVNTTNGADVPAKHVQVSSNLRDTKDKAGNKIEVDPALRYRNAMIPELSVDSVEQKFHTFMLSALYEVANRRFTAEMEESNRMAKHIESEHYTVSALLSWFETEATSGRMTTEQVQNWFKAGDTYKLVVEKKGEKVAADWLKNYAKFASPNHGVNPNTCRVLLAGMQPADTNSEIGKAIAARMQRTIEKSEVSQVEGL